jgi:tetratricopeptide (TPR) repeat protein
VAENPRIEELRRRVQKDKASIAFAQLAEEYRRAGRFQEAIDTCRTGLSHHPGYLSAHVTLGRALIETGDLQPAEDELRRVLDAAPENLAARKGLAEIHHRRGEWQDALAHYRRALDLAPHDPELEHLVAQITRTLEPARQPAPVPDGLSFEEAVGEFLAHNDRTAPPAGDDPAAADPSPAPLEPPPVPWGVSVALEAPLPVAAVPSTPEPADSPAVSNVMPAPFLPSDAPPPPPPPPPPRAALQVEALERWLEAILADRQNKA